MTIDGYEDVPPNDADSLRKALAHQPVAVAICASPAMQVGCARRGGGEACRGGGLPAGQQRQGSGCAGVPPAAPAVA